MSNEVSQASISEYCALLGRDTLLVQGAGGNISWKEGSTLWVKASGMWLSEAKHRNIFVPVELEGSLGSLSEFNADSKLSNSPNYGLRPSIEVALHSLMPHKVVLHLHAVEVLSYLVRLTAKEEIDSRLHGWSDYVYVDYVKPGKSLASEILAKIKAKKIVNTVLMKNHGIVIGGSNIEEVNERLLTLLQVFAASPKNEVNSFKFCESKNLPIFPGYKPVDDTRLHCLATNPQLFSYLDSWALYPDHIVFLGPKAFKYRTSYEFQEALHGGSKPEVVFIEGLGVWTVDGISLAKLEQLNCYFEVIVRQPVGSILSELGHQEIQELLEWDAEKFRKETSK